ncbi:putative transport protein [Actinobaculum suis]|uniref:Putative transport protein n=1 Tax=Actinobaculum suis TaxID=1657 RepID=A0A1G6ZRI9_9ACTO|nr:TrkA C-terminal domain-containing protein [Actinobaculum suis]MDY5153959.1 TrkA C-terminal domain-containing protein [Actinobaculum suis]SDE04455.1 putative transport protein [Actinobaculum suis]
MHLLASSPLLTLFVVIAAGSIIGAIPFGKIRFGAAGALFVGLVLSAIEPSVGEGMELVQALGLALFVYTIGIAAGAGFFSQLRSNLGLMGASIIATGIAAVVSILCGKLFDIPHDLFAGLFTGAMTSAPAMAAANSISGSAEPSVGYAFGYPLAVVIGIVIVSGVVAKKWPGKKDTPSLADAHLTPVTIMVENSVNLRDIPQWRERKVQFSYLQRDGKTRVVLPGEDLLRGDRVVAVGLPEPIAAVTKQLGQLASTHLADDRSDVEFERFVVSNPDIFSRKIAELSLPARYGATVTRVQRGDLEMLADGNSVLQPGDRVAVVVPEKYYAEVEAIFGNSERKVSEVDALTLALGLTIGIVVGLVAVPLPGGITFSLGTAAGPLIAGMILGALRRTGPFVWQLPDAANLTLRQFGLLLFLAGLGLTAGPSFATVLTSPLAWKAALTAIIVTIVGCIAILLLCRYWLNLSAPRSAGAMAGFLGQAAILEAAVSKVSDERIDAAYAALFAFAIIIKIALVPVVLMV